MERPYKGAVIHKTIRSAIENELKKENRITYIANEYEVMLQDLEGLIKDRLTELENWARSLTGSKGINSLSPKTESAGSPGEYQRSLEKRLYLMNFVTKDMLDWPHIRSHSLNFKPKRINWTNLSKEWNKMHPHDLRTPDNLRSEYYHVKKRYPETCQEFFLRKEQMLATATSTLTDAFTSGFTVDVES